MNTETNLNKENISGTNPSDANANTPVRVLTATSIIGDNVENKHGESWGEIKDVMLNMQDGRIEYLIIEFGGFLGFGKKLFALPFSVLKLNAEKKCFVLGIDKEFLEKAPGFDQDHWPETNSHYADVSTHWAPYIQPYTPF